MFFIILILNSGTFMKKNVFWNTYFILHCLFKFMNPTSYLHTYYYFSLLKMNFKIPEGYF